MFSHEIIYAVSVQESIKCVTRLISIVSQPIRVVVVVVCVVIDVTVDIIVTVGVVVIIVGPRKLTLKYGQNQVSLNK